MKPKVFIGSSTEGRPVAEALQIELDSDCDCILWSQGVFQPGRAFLEDLVTQAWEFDFAVLVLTPDDRLQQGDVESAAPRDNVVFEAGLFIGSLGRDRTFIVRPKDVPNFSVFTDFAGITVITYDQERFEAERRPAIGAAAAIIKQQFRKPNTSLGIILRRLGLRSEDLKDFYRQTGLTYAFGARREALDRMLDDIKQAKRSVKMYGRVYLSELIKATTALTSAIVQAALHGGGEGDRELTVLHASTHPDDLELAGRHWRLEDPRRRRWTSLDRYRDHLRGSDALFANLHDSLASKLETVPLANRSRVRLRRRYIKDFELPYSVLSVDDRVHYLSFYAMSCERIGTFAPTMRLICNAVPDGSWADAIVEVLREIDRVHLDQENGKTYGAL